MGSNELYLVVLPLIHLGQASYGLTEETLTLFPDKNFATQFAEDEVESYISIFSNRTKYLTGGHVTGYTIHREPTGTGRVVVRVVQNVT
jgi:hypothetical protein